ncbi:hypothetical protein EV368DRAFT_85157 [Lentinula lateritia]|nr:hypothetical protein EV368DRAFT_85157 [Lentinula lateritia]
MGIEHRTDSLQPALITPSASPPSRSHSLFHGAPADTTPSGQKNPSFSGPSIRTGPRFSSTPVSSTETPDISTLRSRSTSRLLSVWSTLAERYSLRVDQDDIVDIRTGQLVKDRGVVRGLDGRWDFGRFAAVGDEQLEYEKGGKGGGREESDDELDSFADVDEQHGVNGPRMTLSNLTSRATHAIDPTNDEDDAADLRAFLEDERHRKEKQVDAAEQDDVQLVGVHKERSDDELELWDASDFDIILSHEMPSSPTPILITPPRSESHTGFFEPLTLTKPRTPAPSTSSLPPSSPLVGSSRIPRLDLSRLSNLRRGSQTPSKPSPRKHRDEHPGPAASVAGSKNKHPPRANTPNPAPKTPVVDAKRGSQAPEIIEIGSSSDEDEDGLPLGSVVGSESRGLSAKARGKKRARSSGAAGSSEAEWGEPPATATVIRRKSKPLGSPTKKGRYTVLSESDPEDAVHRRARARSPWGSGGGLVSDRRRLVGPVQRRRGEGSQSEDQDNEHTPPGPPHPSAGRPRTLARAPSNSKRAVPNPLSPELTLPEQSQMQTAFEGRAEDIISHAIKGLYSLLTPEGMTALREQVRGQASGPGPGSGAASASTRHGVVFTPRRVSGRRRRSPPSSLSNKASSGVLHATPSSHRGRSAHPDPAYSRGTPPPSSPYEVDGHRGGYFEDSGGRSGDDDDDDDDDDSHDDDDDDSADDDDDDDNDLRLPTSPLLGTGGRSSRGGRHGLADSRPRASSIVERSRSRGRRVSFREVVTGAGGTRGTLSRGEIHRGGKRGEGERELTEGGVGSHPHRGDRAGSDYDESNGTRTRLRLGVQAQARGRSVGAPGYQESRQRSPSVVRVPTTSEYLKLVKTERVPVKVSGRRGKVGSIQ